MPPEAAYGLAGPVEVAGAGDEPPPLWVGVKFIPPPPPPSVGSALPAAFCITTVVFEVAPEVLEAAPSTWDVAPPTPFVRSPTDGNPEPREPAAPPTIEVAPERYPGRV